MAYYASGLSPEPDPNLLLVNVRYKLDDDNWYIEAKPAEERGYTLWYWFNDGRWVHVPLDPPD